MPEGLTAQQLQEDNEQLRQHEEEQDEEEIEAMDLAMKEGVKAAEEVAQDLRQMEISEGMDVDDGAVEGAPLSPATSEK